MNLSPSDSMLSSQQPWYKRSFRRNLIDMHIPDHDEQFLSQLDPQHYIEMLELAHVDTAMIYADSCLGICYWPTKLGHMHRGIQDRDMLGEIIQGCHQKGIDVVVYYNFWSKWAYDEHPEWRFISKEGKGTTEYLWTPGRYGVCCFNTPYRQFMHGQIEDLCQRYDFEGLWVDMIFWPDSPCYCSACSTRYRMETGEDLPRNVNWEDTGWVRFQRKREEWLAQFIGELTAIVKRHKPDASVGHQCSAWSVGWHTGLNQDAFRHSDYVSGDFYGDSLLQSFTCKAFHHLTENRPFEFMTSRSPDLTDHTTTKSKELLRAQMFSALANQGAFLFIDAIDPIGTLDRRVYEMMGELYREAAPYESYIDHEARVCQDVAIYLNFESIIEANQEHGTVVTRAKQAAKALMNAHIPYGVITKKNLNELDQFQVILLLNVIMLDEEEVETFKRFVHEGGSIYASKRTSMMNKAGERQEQFQLNEVLGVNYEGETVEEITYLAPVGEDAELLAPFTRAYPAMIKGKQIKVQPGTQTRTVGTMTLPYTDPRHPDLFASAISDPPGRPVHWPVVTQHEYGQGRAMYCSGDLEMMPHDVHRTVFSRLVRSLGSRPFYFATDAPSSVELILFHDEKRKRYRLHVLNMQMELPNIPVLGAEITVNCEHKEVRSVTIVPSGEAIDFKASDGAITFFLPRVETFAMLLIAYG